MLDMSHQETWVRWVLDSLQSQNEDTIKKVLEQCGRWCCQGSGYNRRSLDAAAKSKDDNEFLENLRKTWDHLELTGGEIYVIYPKCYCPIGQALVKEFPGKVSGFCNCSVDWVKEMFEPALKRTVKVRLLKSVVHGDDHCRFKVTL